MRLISHLLSFFLCLLLAGGLPGHHGHYDGMHRRWKAVQQHARDEATLDPICLPIPTEVHSQNDLLSKIRPADGVCQLDEHVLQPPSSSSVIQLPRRQDDDPYSCNENKPCGNHACCAKSGFCGYGPDYCGTDGQSPNDVCWSNCDAHAECGRHAETVGQECPLKVCCSQFGFCGTTAEFCAVTEDEETSCQSNCETPSSGSSGGDVQKRIIGYYEAWNYKKKCIGMGIQDIPVGSLTHLYYSFGYIKPETYEIIPMDDGAPPPEHTFTDMTDLKRKNPGLKVVVALGGWTFNDNHTIWQPVFSDLASTQAKRAQFIREVIKFMTRTGFDGVDIDWEYPGAPDRGGHPEDGENFTKLLEEMRVEFDKLPSYKEISFTAPTSYWYLRHFDIKASVDACDFVNVMAYDLHGVWDADNPIGAQVLAHTNITEIGLALELLWRNDVPAGKVNMGLGFYGRSFQLSDPSCFRPGCMFKGGAAPGPCTENSGTLSYREIMDIIKQHSLTPYYDQDAGVKYITWGGDQWVSYDDFDTFQQKIEFANALGLGGLLIWAIDLDTPMLDALEAVVYPERLGSMGKQASFADNWQDADGGHCRVTACGEGWCHPGEIHVTSQQCEDGDFWTGLAMISSLCCPLSSAPDPEDCEWRGGAPACNGQCHPGEVALQSSLWGDGAKCWDGRKFYCCPAVAELPRCRWTECDESSCTNEENELTWAWGGCGGGSKHRFCCDKDQDWKNCAWHGKPGSCFDNHCETGWQVSMTTAYEGEGEDCGFWHQDRKRSFCCDPPDGVSPFLPVPLEYLFPDPPPEETADTEFTLKVDPTYGNSIDVPFNEDPTNAPFGFVVMTSPDEIQVTLDRRDGSHWEVFDCFDAVSEEEQTVRMVCTDTSDQSNCGKIHLGHGAPGTIVEMPEGCGPGKYAVVKSMTPSAQQVLPEHLVKRGIAVSRDTPVYDLTFDYDFTRVPRDLGDTQLRIDFSNEPEYWNNVVDKAAGTKKKTKRSLSDVGGSHKRWLEEEWRDDMHFGGLSREELHRRWFGEDIISWLQGLINGVSGGLDIGHSYSEQFIVKLVDERLTCPNIAAKLEIKAEANVEVTTNYGFTLIATLSDSLIPDLSNSYLYFRNRGHVDAKFTLEAAVTLRFDTEDILLFSADQFGAAFAVPGIVTIGPNFKIFGQIEGEATVGVKLESKVVLADWDMRQTFPVANNDWDPEASDAPNKDGTQSLLDPTFEYGLRLQGHVSAHVKPTISFGIDFNRKLINIDSCTVNLVADGYLRFHAEFETGGSGNSFCYGLDAGADIYATLEAPAALSWALPQSPFPIIPIDPVQIYPASGDACFDPFAKRDLLAIDGRGAYADAAANNATSRLGRRRERLTLTAEPLEPRAQVYGPLLPRLPGLRCPGEIDLEDIPPCPLCEGGSLDKRDGESCIVENPPAGERRCPSESSSKRSVLVPRADKTLTWNGIKFSLGPYPDCNVAKDMGMVSKWWGYEEDNSRACPVEIQKLTKASTGFQQSHYASDHVYEANLLKLFLEFLVNGPMPAGYTKASMDWVTQTLVGLPVGGVFNEFFLSDSVKWGGNDVVLIQAMAKALGGNGNAVGLAILYNPVNEKKRAVLEGQTPATGQGASSNLAARRLHRNAYGVFSYLKNDIIWSKFTSSSHEVEDALNDFDQDYPWGTRAGEIVRPTRGSGQPRAGLRDLYCYWIDTHLATVEATMASWARTARSAYEAEFGKDNDGIKWLATEMGPNGAITAANLKFPSSLNRHATRGQNAIWAASNYQDLWRTGTGFGAAGPF